MKRGVLGLALLLSSAGAAHADGYYYSESFGIAGSHGDIHHYLNEAFDVRAAIGMRIGPFAVETWLSDDRNLGGMDGTAMAAIEREGGQTGRIDIAGWGLNVKYLTAVTPRLPHLEVYLRGSANVAEPVGSLEGYRGRGVGGGAGIQLKGKVRALGFLWTPLFFAHRGPMVIGSLFVDSGLDYYWLHRDADPAIGATIVHVNVGFSVGTDF